MRSSSLLIGLALVASVFGADPAPAPAPAAAAPGPAPGPSMPLKAGGKPPAGDPDLSPIGPKAPTPSPRFNPSKKEYMDFVTYYYGGSGIALACIIGVWCLFYFFCRLACGAESRVAQLLCCSGKSDSGYGVWATTWPKLAIALVLVAVAAAAVAGFLFNEFWSDAATEFMHGYSNVTKDIEKDTTFVADKLNGFGGVHESTVATKLQEEMAKPIASSQQSYKEVQQLENYRKSMMILVCILPVMGLAFGLFGGLCMSPWGAKGLIALSFLSLTISWAGFATHNMVYRFNNDVCRDIKQYSMNKTGSSGLTYFINCPKNNTMGAPFNSSFVILKASVNALNAAQRSNNLLAKDMGAVEVFGALDTPPTPKQGVFIKALTVVVKKDIDAIRTQITYQSEGKNLSTAAQKVVMDAIKVTEGWSSAVTKSSEMARCMFITEFFAEADKTICDQTPKGGLYGCVEICFSMGVVMVLGLFLGILGEVRFDEQNGDGFKSGSNSNDPEAASILASQDKENGVPDVPDSMVDTVGKKP